MTRGSSVFFPHDSCHLLNFCWVIFLFKMLDMLNIASLDDPSVLCTWDMLGLARDISGGRKLSKPGE